MIPCVDVYVYKKEELIEALKDSGANDEKLTIEILKECGFFLCDKYIILQNEYYEEFCPFYNVAKLLDKAFELEDSLFVFIHVDRDMYDGFVDFIERNYNEN